ncbi:STAS domain-containing protein [Streptacidiphilus sp. PB12-B1b]|uniref:STAS domain-containing protein n=1 Tax=Streptacidiphilus sp. PB12-B1b TaxID=2705012 RepID=UPI0015FDFB81|nr:STAS domain-containing protein [Streptacidiphilus sp. PB12-B1b]QMU78360.1 STAS domain-containing protein [Streptacidiphilus sp. PB12-B1b]
MSAAQVPLTRLPALLPFESTARHAWNGVVVVARGELDLATAPHFEAALAAHLRNRPQTLTIDLSAVTFIDCAGLNVLLRARVHARRSQTDLHLDPISRPVTRLLTLTDNLDLLARPHRATRSVGSVSPPTLSFIPGPPGKPLRRTSRIRDA